jgi:transmembrane sensor
MAGLRIDRERIERYFKGEFSEEDKTYVEEVFSDNNNEDELNTLLRRQFYELKGEDQDDKKDLDQILYKIHYDINTRLSKERGRSIDSILRWTLRVAGVLILPLVIILGIQMFKGVPSQREAWVEIKAPAWTRAMFSLPDGTTGWLNSNSSVRYKGTYNTDRQVILTGEAFFDVVKDKKRPFIVNTNEVILKVLGTRFNVTSYENEKNVEVVLEEGKLMFYNKEMSKSYEMNPYDLITYDKTSKDLTTEVVEPQKYLSWTEGKLVFRNDPLDVIARRLERWYNIEVEIKGKVSSEMRLRATFIDEDLEEVLGLLKRSLPIEYSIENRALNTDETYTKKKVILTLNNN